MITAGKPEVMELQPALQGPAASGDGSRARLRLVGPPGTITDLVTSLLTIGGFTVEVADAATPVGDADVLVLVFPGQAEWEAAGAFPGGVILVSERDPTDAEVVAATLTGADAVVNLDVSPTELFRAVEGVRRGGTLLTPFQARLLVQGARSPAATFRPPPSLTRREQAILASAQRGESVKQTARALGISPKTVENLQSRLFRKLGARNRAHAVVLAHRFGLLPATDAAIDR